LGVVANIVDRHGSLLGEGVAYDQR
jgi:hypothetical protein